MLRFSHPLLWRLCQEKGQSAKKGARSQKNPARWQSWLSFQIFPVSLYSFLLLNWMTSGLYYRCNIFLVAFPIFFVLCSTNGLAALAVQYESKLPRHTTVPEIIDPVFAKSSQNARFLLSENQRFGLVFVKTGSINSGTLLSVHASERLRECEAVVIVSTLYIYYIALLSGNSNMTDQYLPPLLYIVR